jgi:hypothetical protein
MGFWIELKGLAPSVQGMAAVSIAFFLTRFARGLQALKRTLHQLWGGADASVLGGIWKAGLWKLGQFRNLLEGSTLKTGTVLQSTCMSDSHIIRHAALEETLKRVVPYGTHTIIALEAFRHRTLDYIPTAVMHVLASRLNLMFGIWVHSSWNFFVKYRLPRLQEMIRTVGPLDVCVDEIALRANEDVSLTSKFRVPGHNPDGRLACTDGKPSWYYRAVYVEGVEVTVFRSCACNERAAIRSRVVCQDPSESMLWPLWWPKARKMPVVAEPDLEVWLRHLPTRARGKIQTAPTIAAPNKRDQLMQAFVKRELAVSKIATTPTKVDPVPRIIQGRSVAIKVATGRFTWAYGKALRTVYPTDSLYVYGGGCSSEDIGQAFDRIAVSGEAGAGKWYAFDCKRFDRTVGPAPMACLYDEYKACGAPRDCLAALAGRDGERVGSTRNGILFSRIAQVSSGDGDTTCGNSRIHLVLLEACPVVGAAIVMGDDAVVWTDNPGAVCDAYRAGGLEPKVSPDLDFCSALFWPTEEGSVLGPKIGRLLGKTFHAMNKMDGGYQPWLRGVCLGLLTSCSHVPILRVLVPHMLGLAGQGPVHRPDDYRYKLRSEQMHVACPTTWEFTQLRYGLSESDVISMEQEVSQLSLGQALTGERWIDLVRRDA